MASLDDEGGRGGGRRRRAGLSWKEGKPLVGLTRASNRIRSRLAVFVGSGTAVRRKEKPRGREGGRGEERLDGVTVQPKSAKVDSSKRLTPPTDLLLHDTSFPRTSSTEHSSYRSLLCAPVSAMAKRKARAGKSSLFASLPQELRQTITSSLTTQVLIPTAPSSAPSPSSSSAPVSEAGPSSLKRSAPESAQEDVVIKRRKAWSEEDERQGRKHPWDCEGLVERYDKSKRVPLELRKCELPFFCICCRTKGLTGSCLPRYPRP